MTKVWRKRLGCLLTVFVSFVVLSVVAHFFVYTVTAESSTRGMLSILRSEIVNYYDLHGSLPPKLADLPATADFTDKIGLPFEYSFDAQTREVVLRGRVWVKTWISPPKEQKYVTMIFTVGRDDYRFEELPISSIAAQKKE
jgi:hypothetical protein